VFKSGREGNQGRRKVKGRKLERAPSRGKRMRLLMEHKQVGGVDMEAHMALGT
jgi:hypothetical protein